MKISKAIETLSAIQAVYGDIAITGGFMSDDRPLSDIIVTDTNGVQIWPNGPKGRPVDGVYLT